MTDVQCSVSFEGQQFTISDCILANPGTLSRGVREGRLYRFLVDPVAFAHSSERLEEPSIFEEVHAEHGW